MESSESRVSFSASVVSHMYVSHLNLPNFKQALPLCFRKSQICMGYTLLRFPVTVELSDWVLGDRTPFGLRWSLLGYVAWRSQVIKQGRMRKAS